MLNRSCNTIECIHISVDLNRKLCHFRTSSGTRQPWAHVCRMDMAVRTRESKMSCCRRTHKYNQLTPVQGNPVHRNATETSPQTHTSYVTKQSVQLIGKMSDIEPGCLVSHQAPLILPYFDQIDHPITAQYEPITYVRHRRRLWISPTLDIIISSAKRFGHFRVCGAIHQDGETWAPHVNNRWFALLLWICGVKCAHEHAICDRSATETTERS